MIDKEKLSEATLRLSSDYPLLDFSFCDEYEEELLLILEALLSNPCERCAGIGYIPNGKDERGTKVAACPQCEGKGAVLKKW